MPSNVENILNAILTGDGSGIQKPASRVEELLFEIYEQGGGGGGESVIGGIKLTIDENYVMTATLVDKDGEEYGVSDDIDLPLEEMVVDAEYDPQTQKIKLELKNGNYVEFSVAELVSGLQTELSSDNKLNPAYIAYDTSHRAVSDTEKNTWNAKQNAISDLEAIRSGASAGATAVQPATMSEALAAKQNSLSETQLAAVNSGIDSTKVSQIATNKENVEYAIDTGATNQFFILNGYYQLSSVASVTADNGVLTFSNSAAYTSNDEIGKITLKAGTYVLTNRYVKVGGSIYGDIRLMDGETNLTSGEVAEFTIGTDKTLSLMAYVYTGSLSNPVTIKPLLYEKVLWDQATDYNPPALTNARLTAFESEDRAALAEVVDSGAKNLYDFTQSYGFDNCAVDSNGEYTAATGDTRTALNLQATINNGNSVLRHITGSGYVEITANGIYSWTFVMPSGADRLIIGHNGSQRNGRYYQPITGLEAGKTYVFRINVTQAANASGTFKWKDIMICTKAAFDVSQKFVPYRPSWEALREQIEYLTPSLKSKRYICSTVDYEQCADVAITVPSGKTIQYTANLKFNNSPPRGVQVRTGTDLTNLNQVVGIQETTQNYGNISVTGLFTNTTSSPVILYIYVKSNSVTSGGNDVVTNVFMLN